MAADRHEFNSVLGTLQAALPRVIPLVWRYPPPRWNEVYDVYVALNPGISTFMITSALCTLQIVIGFLSRTRFATDAIADLIPPLCALLYALHPVISSDRATDSMPDLRLAVMALLAVLWFVRRRRRAASSARPKPFRNRLMRSIAAAARAALHTAVAAPLYAAWVERGTARAPLKVLGGSLGGLDILDNIASVGCVLALVAQSIADKTLRARGGVAFDASAGPFAWCRHPGESADIAFWSSYYLFAVAAVGEPVSWYGVGAALYAIVTLLSTVPRLDGMRSNDLKSYHKYSRQVTAILPIPPSFNYNRNRSCNNSTHPKKE